MGDPHMHVKNKCSSCDVAGCSEFGFPVTSNPPLRSSSYQSLNGCTSCWLTCFELAWVAGCHPKTHWKRRTAVCRPAFCVEWSSCVAHKYN